MTITNQQLREAFLSPQMKYYFEQKLSQLPCDEVGVRVEEALKFLNMAVYCHANIPVSPEIDEIWHYWILETKEYEKLYSALQGGKFLHHSSNVYLAFVDRDLNGENDLAHDVAMLGTYVLNYGPFEESRVKYWLLAAHLVDKCGWKVQQLNRWLTSTGGSRRRAMPSGCSDARAVAHASRVVAGQNGSGRCRGVPHDEVPERRSP